MDHLIEEFAINPGLKADLVISGDENGQSIPNNHVDFFTFPERQGWYISEDQTPQPKTVHQNISAATSLADFLQQWLFFGLIFTVVQKDGTPVVSRGDLISGRQVSTKCLSTKLPEWMNWERSHPDGLAFRMLRTDLVLEQARRVVKAVCGVKNGSVRYTNIPRDNECMTDELALSLMTVGEILCAVKHQIMETNSQAHLPGWHGDDDSGWGPPRYVFTKMEKDRWCKRTVHLLKCQLRANATLLLAAWTAWKQCEELVVEGHDKCTPERCAFFPGNNDTANNEGKMTYHPRHCDHCGGADTGCPMEGPDVSDVCRLLKEDDIPLVRMNFDEDGKFQQLSVVRWEKGVDFICISHVWSHGYGNEEHNKVAKCQLEFICRQVQGFRGLKGAYQLDMWMDTLVIPVEHKFREQRKIAMMQIERVFHAARSTLVLDLHLISMDRGDDTKPAQAAMRLLVSGWMRRLWTLQEAFLSRQLIIPFREGIAGPHSLKELDSLSEQFHTSVQEGGISSALLTTVKSQLLHNLMGYDRYSRNQNRINHMNPIPPRTHGKSGALLLSNLWRAARFRDVGKPEIEARALATLLGLNYRGTDIEEAGIDADKSLQLNKLMMDFWTQVDEQLRAIPPGIIFLPGKKIYAQGFGWAPSTWLNADEIEYPDPLRTVDATTMLHPKYGLLVQYPGFLLHAKHRDQILRVATTHSPPDRGFCFPVDRHLQEWYRVTSADETANDYIEKTKSAKSQLAIVLCRPRPKDSIPEIGLLVESWQVVPDPGHDEMKRIFCTYVIHRVWVSRHSAARYSQEGTPTSSEPEQGPATSRSRSSREAEFGSHEEAEGIGEVVPPAQPSSEKDQAPAIPRSTSSRVVDFFNNMEAECIGEVVPPDQSWYVDRRLIPAPPPRGKILKKDDPIPRSRTLQLPDTQFVKFMRRATGL